MLQKSPLSPFFVRNGLSASDLQALFHLVHERYPGAQIEEVRGQGGCSYTLAVTRQTTGDTDDGLVERFVVQFRLLKHAVPFPIAGQARTWYGNVVPTIQSLGCVRVIDGWELQMCRMSHLAGTRFSELQPKSRLLDDVCLQRYRSLIEDLVDFYATAWETGTGHRRRGNSLECSGKVGSTLQSRLQKLEYDLPSCGLRAKARRVRARLEAGVLSHMPVVLTHGDLIPSNILVDHKTWKITGLVDWAEAEYLPFGVNLYGLEHLLGYLEGKRFVYYEQAHALRHLFWRLLRERIPDLRAKHLWEAAKSAQVLGILLWHGYAWDDGKIDRVVQPGRDDDELAYLTAFIDSIYPDAKSRL